METEVKSFGNYTKNDSIAPSVVPVNISEGKNMASQNTFSLKFLTT
jgi:hypothetical protein